MDMFYLTPLRAAETTSDEPVWIQYAPYGTWKPYGQDLSITPEMAAEMVANFKNRVRGHEIELDYDHKQDRAKGNKASGWILDLEQRQDGVWALVKWTPQAREEIKNGEWRYLSGEWATEWPHPTTGITYKNVIFGGGLTNRPQHKGRLPINASELVLETEMADTDVQGQKQDQADHDNPLDPNFKQPEAPGHQEPGTAGDNPPMQHPADDDPSNKDDSSFIARMKAWFDKNHPEALSDTNNEPQEGDVVKLDEFRTRLGLSADADEDAILAAVDGLKAEVEPLRKVAAEFEAGNKFASEYPEQHARMVALEQEQRTRKASEFADQFTDIGDGKALSPVAREKVADAYLAAENGTLKASELGDVLAAVTSKENVIDTTEHGSSLAGEPTEPSVNSFVERIRAIQKEDNLDYRAAVKLAGERYPDEALAYQQHFQNVKGGE